MYQIKLCETNQAFLDRYHEIIKKNAIEMNLFVKNLKPDMILEKYHIRGGVYKDDELVLLFLNAYPFNFLIFNLIFDEPSIQFISNYLLDNNTLIRGINARKEVCETFIKYTNLPMSEVLAMDIMVLNEINEVDVKGKLEIANSKDLDIISDIRINFYKETLNQALEKENSKLLVEADISNQTIYKFINFDNEVVSILKFNELLPEIGVISLVYTYKKHRNKNYAKMMITEIAKLKLSKYKDIILFVYKKNPISNKVYKDIGFKILCDNYDFRINL